MNEEIRKIQCGYLKLTEEGVILEGNDYFVEMIGYFREELLNQSLDNFLSTASKTIFHSLFLLQVLNSENIEEMYLTLIKKDKSEIPIQLNARFIQCDEGSYIECIFVRITKRSSFEKELQIAKAELELAYKEKERTLLEENRLRKLFETTLYSIHEGIIVTDKTDTIKVMNKLAERYTGWTSKEAVGRPFTEVFHAVDITSGEECAAKIIKRLVTRKRHEPIQDVKLISKNKREIYIEGNAAYMKQDEEITGAVTTFRDVTKLFLQDSIIDSFLNINMEILCVYDLDLNIHKVNKKFLETTGYREEELLGHSFLAYMHKEDVEIAMRKIENSKSFHEIQEFTNRILCSNGEYKFLEWRVQLSMGEYIFASARDVTSKRQENESLVNIAMKDQLTGLHNRHFLDHMIYDEMIRSDKFEYKISLAILDLDRFKLVNDTWGHPVGDDQLVRMAELTASCLRKGDWFIRFGGEEFIVILPQTSLHDAVIAMEKVRKAYEMYEHPVTGKQTMSIGIAEKKLGEVFQSWYERADESLYTAKEQGRNRIVAN